MQEKKMHSPKRRNDWTMICNTQNGFGGIDTSTWPFARYGAAVK